MNWHNHEVCDAGLPSTGTASRTSTPPINATTQRVETSVGGNPPAAQTATTRLRNDRNSPQQQQKKNAKSLPNDSSNDNIKGRRQTNKMSMESSVTRHDHDVPSTVSKQRNDFAVDIRTPSQPPEQRLPTATVRQPVNDFSDRLSEQPSSLYVEQQSSSHIRAEEFLQVSSLYQSVTKHFLVTAV